MSSILALMAAQWQVTRSYRLQTLLSFAGLAFTVVPLFFVAQAVQPVMAQSIQSEGGSAFGFLLGPMDRSIARNRSCSDRLLAAANDKHLDRRIDQAATYGQNS